MTIKIIVQEGQTIIDIALQQYGGVEGVQLLIADNNLPDGFATVLIAGQTLLIKSGAVDPAVLAAIKAAGIKPKTGGTLPSIRLVETGDRRLLENGGYRLLEK